MLYNVQTAQLIYLFIIQTINNCSMLKDNPVESKKTTMAGEFINQDNNTNQKSVSGPNMCLTKKGN